MIAPQKRVSTYVCSAINSNDLISEMIQASSDEEASLLFVSKYNIKPAIIHGPFRKKKIFIDNNQEIKFLKEKRKAIYKDWSVTAIKLELPVNSYYLLFNNKIDGKKSTFPKGNTIVKESELEFTNE